MKTYNIRKPVSVGIYDNCQITLRVLDGRSLLTQPGIRWQGNTGGYHEYKHRITGNDHAAILAAAADGADDTAIELAIMAVDRAAWVNR